MSMTIPTGTSAASIGLSGMRAAQRNLDTSAHNIANAQTPGFQRQTVEQTAASGSGGVNTTLRQAPEAQAQQGGGDFANLADDVVNQRISLYSFAANLKTVQTQDDMLGTLLDTKA
jgi:flagellar hook-associated protein FlgK